MARRIDKLSHTYPEFVDEIDDERAMATTNSAGALVISNGLAEVDA